MQTRKEQAMNKQTGFTLPQLIVLLVILAGGFGWCWNIVKLISMSLDPITGLLIVRAIGIFVFPVGMIVGYL